MQTSIIGIDCATVADKTGLALGRFDAQGLSVQQVAIVPHEAGLQALLGEWLAQPQRVLLALDAPLGWPEPMGRLLSGHMAGGEIDCAANQLFRRHTDRYIKQHLGKLPLDVGADRIARTALAALRLLAKLRETTAETIPLAWQAEFPQRIAAIEVYPAGTLTAYGLPSSGYKPAVSRTARELIINALADKMTLPADDSLIKANADALDAVLCLLAGADFLRGAVMPPEDQALAAKEGWIWVRPRQGDIP